MGDEDAWIHTAGDDSDRRASAGGWWTSYISWLAAAVYSPEDWAKRSSFEALKAFERGWREAETRHESVDGVHSREARQETEVEPDKPRGD